MQEKNGTKDVFPPQPGMWMEACPSRGCLVMLRHSIFSLDFSLIIETVGIMGWQEPQAL